MPADPSRPNIPPPPRGASPELALMLSTIADPTHRQTIIDCYHGITEGVDGHLLGEAAAMFAALIRANLAGRAPEEMSAALASFDTEFDLKPFIAEQADRAVMAARATNARVLKIAIVAAFLAGMVVMAILLRVL